MHETRSSRNGTGRTFAASIGADGSRFITFSVIDLPRRSSFLSLLWTSSESLCMKLSTSVSFWNLIPYCICFYISRKTEYCGSRTFISQDTDFLGLSDVNFLSSTPLNVLYNISPVPFPNASHKMALDIFASSPSELVPSFSTTFCLLEFPNP